MKAEIKSNYSLAKLLIPTIFDNKHTAFVNVKIDKINYIALIDTGSSNTFISKNIIEKHKLDNLIDYDEKASVKTLDNKIDTLGRIWFMTINLDTEDTMLSPIILNDDKYTIILGYDFLVINKIDIIITNNILRIKNKEIKLF